VFLGWWVWGSVWGWGGGRLGGTGFVWVSCCLGFFLFGLSLLGVGGFSDGNGCFGGGVLVRAFFLLGVLFLGVIFVCWWVFLFFFLGLGWG